MLHLVLYSGQSIRYTRTALVQSILIELGTVITNVPLTYSYYGLG